MTGQADAGRTGSTASEGDSVSGGLPQGVMHLRCDNPGPMTLTGTNTYVVDAGAGRVVVIDPGPKNDAHCAAVVATIARMMDGSPALEGDEAPSGRYVDILLTHHHDDHEGGASDLVAALVERDVRARLWGGASGEALVDGAMVGRLQAVLVPGHTADSAAFVWMVEGVCVLFSGDTLLGGSSSFIAHPDGDLTAYLCSLDVLADVLAPCPAAILAPGHGEVAGSAFDVIASYQAHRQARLDEVRAVLATLPPPGENADDGARMDAVIEGVYAGLDSSLRPVIEAVVCAQLAHLDREAAFAAEPR